MSLCPFCGGESTKSGRPCDSEKCQEASARVPLARRDSRGVPEIRRGWSSQKESERLRRQVKLRMHPHAIARVREFAASRKITFCDAVEEWALSLPETSLKQEASGTYPGA